ncbi:glycosyltransferase family 2 protein [Microbacteriaceae bacterium VKM Ac-2854]|nr:glycosyltransferase family 2 protein [Microbacteriaceae bacterium VKM Ac-2854]
MIVLIPAYRPDAALPALIRTLRAADPTLRVLVVDDGSGPAYAGVFAAVRDAGGETIGYPVNAGKGHALKSGFAHVLATGADDVVTADSDGQHRAADILRVAERVKRGEALVLGGRRFTGDVPLRSRFGNAVSRAAFRLATGVAIRDTQTGLRGFPSSMLPELLRIGGERFDYELAMLLAEQRRLDEIPIETVYLHGNASSHFRPLLDSVRVLRPLLRYATASMASFLLDLLLLQLISWATGSLLLGVVGARLVSASLNFALNRRLVFGAGGRMRADAMRYAGLAAALLVANYLALLALTAAGMPLLPAKLITEVGLYLVGFAAQRFFVFARRGRGLGGATGMSGTADAVIEGAPEEAAEPARLAA